MKIAITTAAVCATAVAVSGIALSPIAEADGSVRPSVDKVALTKVDKNGLLAPGARDSSTDTATITKNSAGGGKTKNLPDALRSESALETVKNAYVGDVDKTGSGFSADNAGLTGSGSESDAKKSTQDDAREQDSQSEGGLEGGDAGSDQAPSTDSGSDQTPGSGSESETQTPTGKPSISGDASQQTEDGIKIAAMSEPLNVPSDRSSVVGVIAGTANNSQIEVRTQSASGSWNAWSGLDYEKAHDGAAAAGTEPFIVNKSKAVQLRVLGESAPEGAKLVLVDPKKTAADQRAVEQNAPVNPQDAIASEDATAPADESDDSEDTSRDAGTDDSGSGDNGTDESDSSDGGLTADNASYDAQNAAYSADSAARTGSYTADSGTYTQGSATVSTASASVKKVPKPKIASRKAWGANESLRHGSNSVAPSVKAAVVHMTDGSNDYSASDVPGILRGIYSFHVKGRGWDDIGYNMLVDKYGRLWQGRAGNVDKPLVGAHVQGYNTGTFGISMLGSFNKVKPTAKALTATEHAIAWKLSKDKVSGDAKTTLSGKRTRTIVGHRDLGETDCPGQQLYNKLPEIRKKVVALQKSGKAPAKPKATQTPKKSPDMSGGASQAAIEKKYAANAKALGARVGKEQSLAGGSFQQYKKGYIGYTKSAGAFMITGDTARLWTGKTRDALGLPLADTKKLAKGSWQKFSSGAAYWSKSTGTRPVWGDLRAYWKTKGLENGHLGYPVSNPVCSGDTCTQSFQGATLVYNKGAGVTEFAPGVIDANAPPAGEGGVTDGNGSAGNGEGSAGSTPKPTPSKTSKPKKSATPTPSKSKKAPKKQTEAQKRAAIVKTARKHIGVKYVWGGTSPTKGWDCSGFVRYVYKKNGIKLPRTSGQQKAAGEVIPRSKAKPGDLIWHPGHITIVSDKKGKLIDAGSTRTNTSERSAAFMYNSGGVVIRVIK